jgi:dinuclear metal center YbgI/SA1388 family protein
MASLKKLAGHLDRSLKIKTIADWPGAMNGLQVENNGAVTKIGAAVDACEASIHAAARAGVDFLIVHHGLFWGGAQPLTGAHFRKIKTALDANLAIYSAHLPLDVHPVFGNNALLSRALGFKKTEPFFFEKGQFIGVKTRLAIDRDELVRRLEGVLGSPVKISPGGPQKTARIGVVTGGAGAEIAKAAGEGVDTFITGEGPHHSYLLAEELGVNLLYGGHYATETFGVKAIAAHLSARFKLPWAFIDHPTGL